MKNHIIFYKLAHYRTRAIISRSRFETALVYKPRILSFKKESRNNGRSAQGVYWNLCIWADSKKSAQFYTEVDALALQHKPWLVQATSNSFIQTEVKANWSKVKLKYNQALLFIQSIFSFKYNRWPLCSISRSPS